MRKIILLLLLSTKLFGQTNLTEQVFTVQQLQEDFLFMRSKMEAYNTNLYLYNSKKAVDQKFDELYKGIDNPMNAREFYKYVLSIQTTVKDGHSLILPSKELQDYHSKNDLYFPLNFTEYKGKLFITQNFSNDSTINTKDEILSINGVSADSLYNYIESRHPRDGDNKLYARYVTLAYFRSYYGFMFGFCKSYTIEIKSTNGVISIKNIDALPLALIKKRRNENTIQRYDRINRTKGIEWSFDKEKNIAYLFIQHWTTKQMKQEYQQSFKKEFKKFFQGVALNKLTNIIVDLRGNQGGNGENGIEFLQHIMSEPFNYMYQVKKYNKRGSLVNSSRQLTKVYKPYSNPFKGNVYILINEGSFSNTCILSETFRKYKRGKLIGTETGGCGIILSGGDGYYVFPNTKINLQKISHRMITVNSNLNNGQGVIPDIIVESTLEQMLNNDDMILKRAIEICSEK
jgi:hypothetical protein